MTVTPKLQFNADNLWRLFNSNHDDLMTAAEGPIAKSCVASGKGQLDKLEFSASVAKLEAIDTSEKLAKIALEGVERNTPSAGDRVASFFKMLGQGFLGVLAFIFAPILALTFMIIGATLGAPQVGGYYGLTLFTYIFHGAGSSADDAFSRTPESYKQAMNSLRAIRGELRDDLQKKLDANPACAIVGLPPPKSTAGVRGAAARSV